MGINIGDGEVLWPKATLTSSSSSCSTASTQTYNLATAAFVYTTSQIATLGAVTAGANLTAICRQTRSMKA
jgi:hypothetical protein